MGQDTPWGSSLGRLDDSADLLLRMGTYPWNSGVLSRMAVELISLAFSACTTLDEEGTRRNSNAATRPSPPLLRLQDRTHQRSRS